MKTFLQNLNPPVKNNSYMRSKVFKNSVKGGTKNYISAGSINHYFNEISLFPSAIIQPKLTINQPNDIYEQEADAMADKVMRMPAEKITTFHSDNENIQRKCKECEEENGLQRKESNHIIPAVSPAVNQTLQSNGKPMDVPTRNFMEKRFGYNLGKVRIHDNAIAHQSTKNIMHWRILIKTI